MIIIWHKAQLQKSAGEFGEWKLGNEYTLILSWPSPDVLAPQQGQQVNSPKGKNSYFCPSTCRKNNCSFSENSFSDSQVLQCEILHLERGKQTLSVLWHFPSLLATLGKSVFVWKIIPELLSRISWLSQLWPWNCSKELPEPSSPGTPTAPWVVELSWARSSIHP